MENLLDQYVENLDSNIVDENLNNELFNKFKECNFFTLVEQDDDGSFFVATYYTANNNEALYIYTSEDEIPLGSDYMDISYDDLKDLLSSSNVYCIIINNESHNLAISKDLLVNNDVISPLKVF